jgi:hypothetical protein
MGSLLTHTATQRSKIKIDDRLGENMTVDPGDSDLSLTDKWLRRLRNNPIIAVLCVFGICVIGVSTFWNSLNDLSSLFRGSTASNSASQTTQSQLLSDMYANPGCVPMKLDKTIPEIPTEITSGVIGLAQNVLGQSGHILLIGVGVVGTNAYALGLGHRRADVVAQFLISHGIEKSSIFETWAQPGQPGSEVVPIGDGFICGVWIKPHN